MKDSQNNSFYCEKCEFQISEQNIFCPNCGSIFDESIKCKNHIELNAEGYCVICNKPYCDKCLGRVEDLFLCNEHSHYENYEGMVRVFGTSDEPFINYLKEILIQENLHPIIYSRKASPYSLGDVNYSLFRASGEFNGHIINEIKLMVPFNETLKAEKIIADIVSD